MNLFTGEEADELFGGDASPTIRHLIDQARQLPRAESATLLWTAALSAPGDLPVYYLLYKLHASLGELDHALRAATLGLRHASAAAGLPEDWTRVQPADADFAHPGPARFWLFTLKAMAFLHLRRRERHVAEALLDRLRLLDPQDSLGISTLEAMLQSLNDD